MRIVLLHNPKAGLADPAAGELKRRIRRRGHEVIYASLKKDDWEAALSARADAVIVAGGDGSIDLTAWRISKQKLPLYVLPIGTANNVALSLGHSLDIEAALHAVEQPAKMALDLGLVSSCLGLRYFVESVGAGLVSELLNSGLDFDDAKCSLENRVKGAVKKLEELCESYPGVGCEMRLDGMKAHGRFLLVEIMNTKFVGPNLPLAPDADLGDGMLDVVCVSAGERKKLRQYLQDLRRGRCPRVVFESQRCRKVEIRCCKGSLHVDDQRVEFPSAVVSLKRRANRYFQPNSD